MRTGTYEYGANKRKFTVVEKSNGNFWIHPTEASFEADHASVTLDKEGNFNIAYRSEKSHANSFTDALEAACDLISTVLASVETSQSQINRFFEKDPT